MTNLATTQRAIPSRITRNHPTYPESPLIFSLLWNFDRWRKSQRDWVWRIACGLAPTNPVRFGESNGSKDIRPLSAEEELELIERLLLALCPLLNRAGAPPSRQMAEALQILWRATPDAAAFGSRIAGLKLSAREHGRGLADQLVIAAKQINRSAQHMHRRPRSKVKTARRK